MSASASASGSGSGSGSSSAASAAVDPKSEPVIDKKEQANMKAQVKTLRATSAAKLKEYMQRMVSSENIKDEKDRANTHLSRSEKTNIDDDLKFPANKPVITGYLTGDVRDRPVMKIDGKNFYCSNVAFFYYLSNIKHANENLTTKDTAWWLANYPYEWEVSHLFDGVRPDVNPLNLTMESHDTNKSRVFCRLLFEKRERKYRETMTEDAAYNKAAAEITSVCQQLHNPVCKFLHPGVGRTVAATLKRRRDDRKNSSENKKQQKEQTKKNAKEKEEAQKESKKEKSAEKKARIAKKRKLADD
jgi:hypothetical protein